MVASDIYRDRKQNFVKDEINDKARQLDEAATKYATLLADAG